MKKYIIATGITASILLSASAQDVTIQMAETEPTVIRTMPADRAQMIRASATLAPAGKPAVMQAMPAMMVATAMISTGDVAIDAKLKVLQEEREKKLRAIHEEYDLKIKALIGDRKDVTVTRGSVPTELRKVIMDREGRVMTTEGSSTIYIDSSSSQSAPAGGVVRTFNVINQEGVPSESPRPMGMNIEKAGELRMKFGGEEGGLRALFERFLGR